MRDAFTPLERAALDGLAWELSAQLPDLSGQIEEASPGQRRVRGPIFLTETIVDRRRPSPPDGHTGRLGTIHVQVDRLEHPIAFQAELLGGRLIALHGDAYGQDLTAVDLDGDVVDQVFRLREDGLPVPHDPRDRDDAIRQASPLRRLQEDPDPPPAMVSTTPMSLSRTSGADLDALFGVRRTASSAMSTTPLSDFIFGKRAVGPADEPKESDAHASVRLGVVAVLVVLALIVHFVFGLPLVGAAILAFWLGRLLLRKTVVAAIARALSARRA